MRYLRSMEFSSTVNERVSAAQCRAARSLLGWTIEELAQHSGVSRRTLGFFEAGERRPQAATLEKIVAALSEQGIGFINDGTVVGVVRDIA